MSDILTIEHRVGTVESDVRDLKERVGVVEEDCVISHLVLI